ncbi:transferase [Acidobacteria bacterium Mor1]|nr:transferase [Acidobacteria bacterium Mor1]
MIVKHAGKTPIIDPDAWVAPDATVVGDVVIGAGARIAHGARIVASGQPIRIGKTCVVLENAVIRSTPGFAATIGNHCLIGPGAHLVGCTVEDQVFIATSAAIFHGAHLEAGCEVRVNGTVHLRSRLGAGTVVPIGWVAVGEPAQVLSPDRHDEIWRLQEPLDFPQAAYGIERADADMRSITEHMSARMGAHAGDELTD